MMQWACHCPLRTSYKKALFRLILGGGTIFALRVFWTYRFAMKTHSFPSPPAVDPHLAPKPNWQLGWLRCYRWLDCHHHLNWTLWGKDGEFLWVEMGQISPNLGKVNWWFGILMQILSETVDGSEILRSPVEVVVYPVIYKVLPPSQVVGLGISEPSTVGQMVRLFPGPRGESRSCGNSGGIIQEGRGRVPSLKWTWHSTWK